MIRAPGSNGGADSTDGGSGDSGGVGSDSGDDSPPDDTAPHTGKDTDSAPTKTYHPSGYLDPALHGVDAKYQNDACLDCHGSDLTGGTSGVSCDTCHDEGWRTDCTFCHGGTENTTGAPPVDISGEAKAISFLPHTGHVTTNIHAAYDCEQCHQKPADVLSAGHFLVSDGTAGVSEVDFTGGLSAAGVFGGAGTESCSNLYCHGTGQGDDGSWSAAQGAPGCDDCHASMDSSSTDLNAMSGEHSEHIRHNIGCHECHQDTVDNTDAAIEDPALHVNGMKDVVVTDDITYEKGTCNGECHNELHMNRTWE